MSLIRNSANLGNGRYLSELRRSNAAGIHENRPARSISRRDAIQQSIEEDSVFGILDEDDLWANEEEIDREPTEDDLREIEEEGIPLDDDEYPRADEEDY